jgi:ribonuclease J
MILAENRLDNISKQKEDTTVNMNKDHFSKKKKSHKQQSHIKSFDLKTTPHKKYTPPADENWFVSLGGSGEIGTNLNFYGHDGKWLMVDFGISFGNDMTPGVDVIMPDISFAAEHKRDIEALIVTHAHEDHCGAIPYLWQKLKCPIYCTPFTAEIVKAKMQESGVNLENNLHVVPLDSEIELGQFKVHFISMTHSIPESCALFIQTKAGNVVHTGDWRVDENPIVGRKTNVPFLKQIGEQGVDVMVCDSTNANVKSIDGSELEVEATLRRIFKDYKHRVMVTCFASNIGRVVSVARAAHEQNRKVALVGRSLWRMTGAAKETGYLAGIDNFISETDMRNYADDELVLICTGSQGEARAAMSKIARGEHQHVRIKPSDLVLFSSREIPGNELALNRVKNNLSQLNVKYMTADDEMIHVSGHPAQDQLLQLYQWVKPKISVPVHGEVMHQTAHAEIAHAANAKQVVIPDNGDLFSFKDGAAHLIDKIKTGKYALQGDKVVAFDEDVIRDRFRMMNSGLVMITLVLDENGEVVSDPVVSTMGIFDESDYDIGRVDEIIYDTLGSMNPSQIEQDALIEEMIGPKVKRYFSSRYGMKPNLKLHIARV